MPQNHRSVTPILNAIRAFLRGSHTNYIKKYGPDWQSRGLNLGQIGIECPIYGHVYLLRDHTNPLRFADCLSARDQPPPEIPGGPYHKTSKIYYYTRDARREVEPPLVISTGKQIAAGSKDGHALKATTPNKVYLA